jgi:hypothetical protein
LDFRQTRKVGWIDAVTHVLFLPSPERVAAAAITVDVRNGRKCRSETIYGDELLHRKEEEEEERTKGKMQKGTGLLE